MGGKGLPLKIRELIWNMHIVDHLKYKEIVEVLLEKNITVTENQIREAIRALRKADRGSIMEKALQKVLVNSANIRKQVLFEINELIAGIDRNNPAEWKFLLKMLEDKIKIADSADRYESRKTPQVQINILQIQAQEKKFEKLVEWILTNVDKSKLPAFEEHMQLVDKTVDAEFKVKDE